MGTFVRIVLGIAVGYIGGALIGYGLIMLLSANVHDQSMEAAMTAAFVAGPIGAVVGAVIALLRGPKVS